MMMVVVMMMMFVRRHVNAVCLLEGISIHDGLGRAFATDNSVQRIDPIGVPIDHGKIM